MPTVHEEIRIQAPIDQVFARVADHEGMRSWPGVKAATLLSEGSPERNGLGAVRRIKAGGVTIDEKVVHYEPPARLDYQITRGLPVQHLGTVTLSEEGGATTLRWHISLESRWPLVARLVAWRLRPGLRAAMRYMRDQLEGT